MAINLGVDPRHADQMVRGVCNLPNGTGRSVRVAVFAKDAKADEAVVMTITKYLGASLNDKDAKYVACGDETERNTVRDNFLKKKLGLKDENEALDAKVMAVCEEMKAAKQRMKDRVAFYYLLAKNEGKLGDL